YPRPSPQNGATCLAYTLADWEDGFPREQAKLQAPVSKNDKTVTLEMSQQSAWLTPVEFFDGVVEDVSDAYTSCKELEAIFDKAFGKESCSLGQVRSVLESILSLIPNLVGPREVH